MRLEGLNENHERRLLASAQYASTLIRDCEQILSATEHPRPFSRYAGTVTSPQRKISAGTRESEHPRMVANGCWPAANSWRRVFYPSPDN